MLNYLIDRKFYFKVLVNSKIIRILFKIIPNHNPNSSQFLYFRLYFKANDVNSLLNANRKILYDDKGNLQKTNQMVGNEELNI